MLSSHFTDEETETAGAGESITRIPAQALSQRALCGQPVSKA